MPYNDQDEKLLIRLKNELGNKTSPNDFAKHYNLEASHPRTAKALQRKWSRLMEKKKKKRKGGLAKNNKAAKKRKIMINFPCSFCNKVFRSYSALGGHVKVHYMSSNAENSIFLTHNEDGEEWLPPQNV